MNREKDPVVRTVECYREELPIHGDIDGWTHIERTDSVERHLMWYIEPIGYFIDVYVKREHLLVKYPEMYLIHGKGSFKAVNDILKVGALHRVFMNLEQVVFYMVYRDLLS
jgi:hypothetical protein